MLQSIGAIIGHVAQLQMPISRITARKIKLEED